MRKMGPKGVLWVLGVFACNWGKLCPHARAPPPSRPGAGAGVDAGSGPGPGLGLGLDTGPTWFGSF